MGLLITTPESVINPNLALFTKHCKHWIALSNHRCDVLFQLKAGVLPHLQQSDGSAKTKRCEHTTAAPLRPPRCVIPVFQIRTRALVDQCGHGRRISALCCHVQRGATILAASKRSNVSIKMVREGGRSSRSLQRTHRNRHSRERRAIMGLSQRYWQASTKTMPP